mmetsp:Transcript_9875/g.19578  ORF Transcript_9875/g.19578 Transcript_9875/m.19578 type:complete len:96 (-) Transcript_9875:1972-2259(-)
MLDNMPSWESCTGIQHLPPLGLENIKNSELSHTCFSIKPSMIPTSMNDLTDPMFLAVAMGLLIDPDTSQKMTECPSSLLTFILIDIFTAASKAEM